ncbi:proteasome regulatory particle base subunit [Ascosphaera aggregata]|nr:proteasome regulatory particle base subunit [Ascosphaera aggregata]
MPGLVSAEGLISFLSEPDTDLRVFALKLLDEQVDSLWVEIAPSVGQLAIGNLSVADVVTYSVFREALCEDESFPQRELASLVAAKVYYHLQEYNESMVFALGAGKLLNLGNGGEFEQTIISSSSAATRGSFNAKSSGGPSSTITPFSQSTAPSKSLLSRPEENIPEGTFGNNAEVSSETAFVLQRGVEQHLQSVIDRLFEQCYQEKKYKQVVGVAVEAKNLEVLRRTLVRASEDAKKEGQDRQGEQLMEYVLDICMSVVPERAFRNEILKLILELLSDLPSPDYFSIAKCVVYLNEHSMASDILRKLVEKGDSRSLAIAYQISFDLYDNSTQEFLRKVRQEVTQYIIEPGQDESPIRDAPGEDFQETDRLLDDQDESSKASVKSEASEAFTNITHILEGLNSIQLNLEFLYRSNKSDMGILDKTRDCLDGRNSLYHSAVTLSNGFMHAGTTRDQFFRDNLEWLGKATNWSKFTATAALGVIHRGNLSQGQKLLAPYLPQESATNTGSVYSQGGSLYAFGLIYANHADWALGLIREHFTKATDEVIQHGGALGLGAAGMGTGNQEIYQDLRQVLLADSAVSGEAIGIAIGLIMLGTGNNDVLEDLVQYAHETQHDKTVRGCAMGMALIMYGCLEAADELINGLLAEPNPTLRYGGILTIALAYAGTGSNKAVRKLLHVAVSDVNDDVRRMSVMSLGFILFRKHQSVPRMVELLSESYNPHVRYGAAMALGISCAGTGLSDAVELLEPMLKDSTDFVRQGALIALAMILVQQNESLNPRVTHIRQEMQKIVKNRHEDPVAKFGCALAMGIIDAGGRNCTISLQTQTGNLNAPGIIGAAVFTQYWYWFPLAHFLSLSFSPTAVIAVDQKLEVPVFKFHSNTKPSMFDYPPDIKAKADEKPGKVKTAVLSTTAQAKRRAAKKGKKAGEDAQAKSASDDKMDIDEERPKGVKEEEPKTPKSPEQKRKPEREKAGYELDNMSRVLPAQLKYLTFPSKRYVPVKKPTGGILVVHDNEPDEPREIIELKSSAKTTQPAPTADTSGNRAQPQPMLRLPDGMMVSPMDLLARANMGMPLTVTGGEHRRGDDRGPGPRGGVVLSEIDANEDEADEAPVPHDFEYESEGDNDAMDEDL